MPTTLPATLGWGARWNDASGTTETLPHRDRVKIPSHQRCSSTNRHGEPCKAKAVKDGKCAMHSGLTDPVAMGRRGGLQTPETVIRRELRDDEKIRDSAKDVLRRGLAGDESITKTMLDAARSVVSWRAMAPPDEPRDDDRNSVTTLHGRPVTGLCDVLELAVERTPTMFAQDPRWPEIARGILAASENEAA